METTNPHDRQGNQCVSLTRNKRAKGKKKITEQTILNIIINVYLHMQIQVEALVEQRNINN